MKEEKEYMPDENDKLSKPGEITILVQQALGGNEKAKGELYEKILPHLKGIVKDRLRGEQKGHTVSSTEILTDVYVMLLDLEGLTVNDRNHFYALASKYIRRYLIDNARRHRRKSNNKGVKPESLDKYALNAKSIQSNLDNMLNVHLALEALEEIHEGWAEIVEMRYFGGLTIQEIAEIKRLNPQTIARYWKYARAWLFTRMGGETTSEQN